ncbi:hypothetical protein H0H92_008434 [Tricholoma furcatifolium]|nr:hypothetical protein H0H92_008434 [Tricholoma furcatifolium]
MPFLKERLENSSQDVKDEVEEYRLNGPPDGVEKNKAYQDAIDRLPRTLKLLRDSIVNKAGWSVVILVGGPHGKFGNVSNLLIEGGKGPDGKTFTESMSTETLEETILKPWAEFLESAYPPDVCMARHVNQTELREESPIDLLDSDDEECGAATSTESKPAQLDNADSSNESAARPRPRPHPRPREEGGAATSTATEPDSMATVPDGCGAAISTATEPDGRGSATPTASGPEDFSGPEELGEHDTGIQTNVGEIEGSVRAASPDALNAADALTPPPSNEENEPRMMETPITLTPQAPISTEAPTTPQEPVSLQSVATISYQECLPSWARQALAFFDDIQMEETPTALWKDLVGEWVKFEASAGAASRSRLPTESRPEEIQWWMKRKRLFTNIPEVCSSEYSVSFQRWWHDMQPSWRKEDIADTEPLTRDVPIGAMWDRMSSGGNNGMFLVVVALAFWALSPDMATTQVAFENAVADVTWTFKMIVPTLSGEGKRRIEDATEEDSQAKRVRLE